MLSYVKKKPVFNMTLTVFRETFKNEMCLMNFIVGIFIFVHCLCRRVGRSPLNSHPETSPYDVCSEAVSRRQGTLRHFEDEKRRRRDEDEKRSLK